MAGSTGNPDSWRVSGRVEEKETGRPLVGYVVAAFDQDLVFDDRLGMAVTDKDGLFEIRFATAQFQDFFETEPDIYLRVYDQKGANEVFETHQAVRRNASRDEKFRLRIPARNLSGPRSDS